MGKRTLGIQNRVLADRESFLLPELVDFLAAQYQLPRISVLEKLLHDLRCDLFDEGTPGHETATPHNEPLDSSDPLDDLWRDDNHDRPRTGWTFHTTDLNGCPVDEPLPSDFRDIHDILLDRSPGDIEHGGFRDISIERKALFRYFRRQSVWCMPDFLKKDSADSDNRPKPRDKLSVDLAVEMFNERRLVEESKGIPWAARHIIALFKRISPELLPGTDKWANDILRKIPIEHYGAGKRPTPEQDEQIMALINAQSPLPRITG